MQAVGAVAQADARYGRLGWRKGSTQEAGWFANSPSRYEQRWATHKMYVNMSFLRPQRVPGQAPLKLGGDEGNAGSSSGDEDAEDDDADAQGDDVDEDED